MTIGRDIRDGFAECWRDSSPFRGVCLMLAVAALAVWILAGCGARSEVRGGSTTLTRKTTTTATPASTVTTTEYAPLPKSGEDDSPPVLVPTRTTTTATQPTTASTEEFSGTATGASGTATGENVDQKVDGTPGKIDLPGGGGSTAGGFASDTTAKMLTGAWVKWVLWVSGLLCVGYGAFLLHAGSVKRAITMLGVGVVLFVGGFFPWALLGLGLLAAVGYVLWHMDASKRDAIKAELDATASAFGKVVRAVSTSPPEVASAIKKAVGGLTTSDEETVIAEIKRREQI